ncbi:MAG: hypothetical protein GX434_18255 [Peptococcaceae bacterium]|nr:hypothetical protein [Peptococcaceae bacterium]
MNINNQLDSLYSRYQNPDVQFVKGGVIDENTYTTSSPKILLLLKEVNDPDSKENWSLVDHINDQIDKVKFTSTWKNAGMWSFAVQNSFEHYETARALINIECGLRALATTNLKKSGGKSVSNYDEIKQHAINYKDLWTSEIDIIKPDVVICGGTYSIVQEILQFENLICKAGTSFGHALGTTFIDFYHPAYMVSPKMLYAYFKEIMQSLGYV